MTQRKPTTEEIVQKIDQLLTILKDISDDLADISKQLKTTATPTGAPVTAAPAQVAAVSSGRGRSIDEVKAIFPKELEEMLFFEESGNDIIIKPRRFLGSENFSKIASLIRSAGGEYISAGKESHFRIPK
jgi:hypothetical protein